MRVVRVRDETRPRMQTWEPKKPSTWFGSVLRQLLSRTDNGNDSSQPGSQFVTICIPWWFCFQPNIAWEIEKKTDGYTSPAGRQLDRPSKQVMSEHWTLFLYISLTLTSVSNKALLSMTSLHDSSNHIQEHLKVGTYVVLSSAESIYTIPLLWFRDSGLYALKHLHRREE